MTKIEHGLSQYRVVFDDGSYAWTNSKTRNRMFLNQIQNWANDFLKKKEYLFLRDVYENLGIPITKESCLVGWIYDEKNTIGDNYVVFDIRETNSSNYIVDFNVNGLIINRF